MVNTICSKNAPEAVGAYSQGTTDGNLIFLSGQVSCDKDTGELIPGNIQEQTTVAMNYIKGILEDAGSDLDHVLKFGVYLNDYDRDFGGMNEAYSKFFQNGFPARICYGVDRLYGGVLVEIDCVAVKK